MIADLTLRVDPQTASTPSLLKREICRQARIQEADLNDWRIVRRSVDARQRRVMVNLSVKIATGEDAVANAPFKPTAFGDVSASPRTAIIVGAGPAGLFAALRAIELGIRPIVVERGKDVDARRADITMLNRSREVDPESNYCFGEGGAGTFSDGKLFTRSKKRGNVGEILSLLHQFGADQSVMVDAHPHIGSERLPEVIKSIRKEIERCGGQVLFNSRVDGLVFDDFPSDEGKKRVTGVTLSDGRALEGEGVILATGHSARDVYRFLHRQGVALEAKGIAVGVRLEHPQHLIDQIQYHSPEGRGKWLPAAEYSFVTQVGDRGVYSFCMCPGGVIVPAASAPGELVVNGMSASARAGRKANSGMVVEVRPGDFPEYASEGPFETLALQEDLERRFYEHSDGSLNAPAQRITDFVASRPSKTLPDTSYIPGIHPERIDKLLPERIARRLQEGFKVFDRKSKGFLSPDATLIGLESRTSSPVRIPRDKESLAHPEIEGLYPCGEGAGFAGGIVSAAIDGRRCMEALAQSRQK